jgi:hypothetical protein
MKGKKLIVIMAIVILIFTIQASCALESDNDFNLTQTNHVNTVNVQIDDVENELSVSSDNITDSVSVSSKEVLGATNENVLGATEHHLGDGATFAQLRSLLTNNGLKDGDTVFLDRNTFSGVYTNYIQCNKNVNIYGGTSVDDPTPAIFDLSKFTNKVVFQTLRSSSAACTNVSLNNIVFMNYYNIECSYMITGGMQASRMERFVVNNCTFINNTVKNTGSLIRNILYGPTDAVLSNSKFYNNNASILVEVSTGNSNKEYADFYTAYNNVFVNNVGTQMNGSTSRSLGLCFKVYDKVQSAFFKNNTFINNTNALHGAAYCLLGRNVIITDNYLEGNQAVYGAGIEAHHGFISVYNSTFVSNVAYGNNTRDSWRDGSGAAIAFADEPDGYPTGNNLVQNCTFIGNKAETYAGAIDIVGDNTQILDCRFYNNTARLKSAGAISVSGKDTLIQNCTFESNSAPSGGAVQLSGNGVTIDNSTFTDNSAIIGGACRIDGLGTSVFNSTFNQNKASHNLSGSVKDNPSITTAGGAIYIDGENTTVVFNEFNNNTADGDYTNGTGLGGALFLKGSSPTFNNNNFTGNDAIFGGAVYIDGDNITSQKINFDSNTAIEGGAIYIEGNNINIDQIYAKDNKAIQGGAVYIDGDDTDLINSTFEDNYVSREIDAIKPGAETLLTMGGAIYINGNYVDVYDNNTFRRNIASGAYYNGGLGGAIAVHGNNTNVYGDTFTLNEAVRGGAIYVDGENATIKDMYFTTNNAVQGGSIFINGANTNITGNRFYDNNATHNLTFNMSTQVLNLATRGGAIAVSGDYSNIVDNNFTYNAAIGINPQCGHGGAIAIDGLHTNITDNIFDDNEAIMGGALYVTGTNTTIDNTNFTNNGAIKGGAVYVKGVNTTIVNSEFSKNNATHNLTYNLNNLFDNFTTEGGALDIVGNNTLLSNLKFSDNNAIGVNTGGGHGGAVAVNGYNTKSLILTSIPTRLLWVVRYMLTVH